MANNVSSGRICVKEWACAGLCACCGAGPGGKHSGPDAKGGCAVAKAVGATVAALANNVFGGRICEKEWACARLCGANGCACGGAGPGGKHCGPDAKGAGAVGCKECDVAGVCHVSLEEPAR